MEKVLLVSLCSTDAPVVQQSSARKRRRSGCTTQDPQQAKSTMEQHEGSWFEGFFWFK